MTFNTQRITHRSIDTITDKPTELVGLAHVSYSHRLDQENGQVTSHLTITQRGTTMDESQVIDPGMLNHPWQELERRLTYHKIFFEYAALEQGCTSFTFTAYLRKERVLT